MLVAAETTALGKGKGEGPGREDRGQEGQDVDKQGIDGHFKITTPSIEGDPGQR